MRKYQYVLVLWDGFLFDWDINRIRLGSKGAKRTSGEVDPYATRRINWGHFLAGRGKNSPGWCVRNG